MERAGLLAAFGTAMCYSISALFFEVASKRRGALAVNFWKIVFAFAFLTISATVLRGMPLPLDVNAHDLLFFVLSGIVGFIITDYFLFTAYILIGSRITFIFQALTPIITAVLAYVFLGERMRPQSVIAMILVVLGIMTVVISRSMTHKKRAQQERVSTKGYIFAFFSAVFQSVGIIFSKQALSHNYNPVSGTQIRVFVGMLGFALQALLMRQAKTVFFDMPRDRLSLKKTFIGAVFGPFLGVTLSLFAVQHASTGAVSTLMALTPVLIIPTSIILLRQKVYLSEIIGASIAVCGAVLFFLL